jgi:hypothetical protein
MPVAEKARRLVALMSSFRSADSAEVRSSLLEDMRKLLAPGVFVKEGDTPGSLILARPETTSVPKVMSYSATTIYTYDLAGNLHITKGVDPPDQRCRTVQELFELVPETSGPCRTLWEHLLGDGSC